MVERIVLFKESEAQRIDAAVKAHYRQPQYQLPRRKRRKIVGGSGGSSCQEQFAMWFSNDPTGGSTVIPFTVGTTTENITINFDAGGIAPDAYAGSAAAYVDTAFASHSLVTLDDIVVTTPGGTFPRQVIRFYFTGDVSMSDVQMGNQVDSFTGGSSPHSTIDRCGG